MPAGQPTKYRKEYCQEVIDFMAKGYSFEAFAGHITVNVDTLHEWAKVHKEFSDAKRTAYEKSRLFWETMGIEGLHNTTWHEGKSGGSKSTNSAIWVFNMKNRFRWRDRVEHSGEIDTSGTREKLKKLLENPKHAAAARAVAEALADQDDNDES